MQWKYNIRRVSSTLGLVRRELNWSNAYEAERTNLMEKPPTAEQLHESVSDMLTDLFEFLIKKNPEWADDPDFQNILSTAGNNPSR